MRIDQHDPEAVVQAAALAMHEERWRDAAALCSPESLREFLSDRVAILRDHRPVTLTWEQWRRMLPELPEEVARWQWEQHRAAGDVDEGMRRELAQVGVADLDALAALEPTTFYERWLAAHSPRSRNAVMLESHKVSVRVRAWFDLHASRLPLLVVLGHVREGERLAHVVVREQPETPPTTMPNGRPFGDEDLIHATTVGPLRLVTVMRDDEERWWLEASFQLLDLGGNNVAYSDGYFLDEEEESDWDGEPPDD